MWGPVSKRLQGEHRLLALDLRGYGESQWSKERRYRTKDHASDVTGVASSLGVEEFDLVGFSWGGLIALSASSNDPERVGRLAMIDIAPSSTLPEDAIPPNFRSDFDDHDDAVDAERALAPRATEATLDFLAGHGSRPSVRGGLERKIDPYLVQRWPFRSDNLWSELRALSQPTLVIRAAESPVLSSAEAEDMGAIPHVTVRTVPEAGHLVVAERPDAVADHLSAFLAR